jgi:hypothetical protein
VLDNDYYWMDYDLQRAYNGGGWDGAAGITSSVARAVAASGSPHRTGLGYKYVTGDGWTLKYTLMGDANLDGRVDLTDFTYVASNYNGYVNGWYYGDFNYDTKVDLTDFTLLASNFNQSLPAGGGSPGLSGATVPEPSSVMTLTALAIPTMTRRFLSARGRAKIMMPATGSHLD